MYVRQLSLHLRTIRNNLTQESIKSIYSWQFYNSVKIWVNLVANKGELELLINPLINVLVGAIRLTTSIKHFPFHLKAFELLTLINMKTK